MKRNYIDIHQSFQKVKKYTCSCMYHLSKDRKKMCAKGFTVFWEIIALKWDTTAYSVQVICFIMGVFVFVPTGSIFKYQSVYV